MRKFFSIVFYIIAGLFLAIVVSSSFQGSDLFGEESLFILLVLTGISILFFILASWIYPLKNWQKPTAITLFSAVGIMLIGTLNNYFVIKGIQNSDIELKEMQILNDAPLIYNFPLGISVSIVFLAFAVFFYKKSLNVL